MNATTYRLEWRFGGRWSRLARSCETQAEAESYARTLFLPPTKAESRPATRIVKVTTTEEVIEDL